MVNEFEVFCEQEIAALSKAGSDKFHESLRYSFFSGGKRFRPNLILSLAKDFGVDLKTVMPSALAVELIHTYSLIHDDLPAMDDDEYRRGKLSHHAKFGEASAVLAGDALLTFAFEVLAEHYEGAVLKNLILKLARCSGANGMVGGQVLDCLTTDRDLKIFEKIHLLKTAKLFEFCCYSVACVTGLTKKTQDNLSEVGAELGVLFQLQDDLLDECKKDEREEENILSVLSRDSLVSAIEDRKKRLVDLMENLELPSGSHFRSVVSKLFDREI